MWDLSPPTGDWTCILCIGKQSLNHWTSREVPIGTSWLSLVPTCVLFSYHTALSIEGLLTHARLGTWAWGKAHSNTWLSCSATTLALSSSNLQRLNFHPLPINQLSTPLRKEAGDHFYQQPRHCWLGPHPKACWALFSQGCGPSTPTLHHPHFTFSCIASIRTRTHCNNSHLGGGGRVGDKLLNLIPFQLRPHFFVFNCFSLPRYK